MDRQVLHIDMNSYYASVECMYNPALRQGPMAVCGDPVNRHGIVLAKNEAAKKDGVKTGEAIWEAKQKCPNLVIVPPHYSRYIRFSRLARKMYAEYSDRVEPFGLDENWVELTYCDRNDGTDVAEELRTRVKEEFGLTASIGVSFNKIFAKLGSDMKKPDAITVIRRDNYKEKVWPLPVSDLLGVGPATTRKLGKIGIRTIGGLATLDPELLRKLFGVVGLMLHAFANGNDTSPVAIEGRELPIKSIGNSITAAHDLHHATEIRAVAQMLAESVAARLREAGYLARTLSVSLRDYQLYNFERQKPLPKPTQLASEITKEASALILENFREGQWIRSLGVRASNLIPTAEMRQLTFLTDELERESMLTLEETVDELRARYGGLIVRSGLSLFDRTLTEHSIKAENVIHPIAYGR
ncbi:MAG TPA: DNA polymerase IV [Fastidiosipila sp.]|nr:DNA polymerase IV [Fastidiosipila sp.]